MNAFTSKIAAISLAAATLPSCTNLGTVAPSLKDPAKRSTPVSLLTSETSVEVVEGSRTEICADGTRCSTSKRAVAYEETRASVRNPSLLEAVVSPALQGAVGAALIRPSRTNVSQKVSNNTNVNQSQNQGQHQGQTGGTVIVQPPHCPPTTPDSGTGQPPRDH